MKRQSLKTMLLTVVGACLLAGFTMTAAAAPTDLFACTTSRDENQDILVDFTEIQLTLPASWAGKCQLNTAKDSVSFYQIKSRDLWTEKLGYPSGGHLFSICFSEEDPEFLDLPSYQTIGGTDDGFYYMMYPSDMQAYTDDDATFGEFMKMNMDISQILDSIVLKTGERTIRIDDSNDYILPNSSTEYLSEHDLAGMDADEIQMAINEIYARHHRKFVLPEVQAYFNSKSWYDGYVEAAKFDTGVMSSIETKNIDLMVRVMNARS